MAKRASVSGDYKSSFHSSYRPETKEQKIEGLDLNAAMYPQPAIFTFRLENAKR